MNTNHSSRRRNVRWDRLLLAALLLIVLLYGICRIFQGGRKPRSANAPAQNSSSASAETPTDPTASLLPTQEANTATEPPTETPSETLPFPEPMENPPASVMIDVPYYSQKGLLPTGCELVSAKMLMEYYGAVLDINTIVENTTSMYPKSINGRSYAPTPDKAFIGSPWDETSFGCFPPVIVEMMNKLLPEGRTAVDTSGTELSVLAETYLPLDMPVLVWATISMLETYPGIPWYLFDEEGNTTDEIYYWPANEHCLVLVGYDSQNYYFNDPYGGRGLVSYSRDLVETRFADIGKFSVVVLGS